MVDPVIAALILGGVIGYAVKPDGKGIVPISPAMLADSEIPFAKKIEIDTSVANDNKEYNEAGAALFVKNPNTPTTAVYIRLNNKEGELFELTDLRKIKGPFGKFFITNEAGAGTLTLIITRGFAFEFIEAEVTVVGTNLNSIGDVSVPSPTDENVLGWDSTAEAWIAYALTDLALFADHKARHQDGGADELSLTGMAGTDMLLTTPKINEAVQMTATSTELNILDNATLTTAELNLLDLSAQSVIAGEVLVGTGAGAAAWQKTGVILSAPDISGIVTAASALTMPAFTMAGALTVGVNGTGYIATFYSDASGTRMVWYAPDLVLYFIGAAGIQSVGTGALNWTGAASIGSLNVIGNSTVQGDLSTAGGLIVIGAGSFQSSVGIVSSLTVNDDVIIGGNIELTGALRVVGLSQFDDNITMGAGKTVDGVDISDHSTRHENAGGDVISVTGLSGLLADDQHVLDSEVKLIKLDDFATPDDNTDLDASAALHGLIAKLDKGKLDDAASAATASKLVIRDASARAKFAAPGASGDALIKGTRVTTAELPAMTDEFIWVGTGTDVEERAVPVSKSIATGTYTGNAVANLQITTGFKCSLVILQTTTNAKRWTMIPNLTMKDTNAADNSDSTAFTYIHATDGFNVNEGDASNTDTIVYYYWAISE